MEEEKKVEAVAEQAPAERLQSSFRDENGTYVRKHAVP